MRRPSATLLAHHVRESNKIEGITTLRGPLVTGHMAAAKLAARPALVHPLDLHKVLTRDVPSMAWHAGAYRRVPVWVGNRQMPQPYMVPTLMQDWPDLVDEYLRSKGTMKAIAHAARCVHFWFLCVHPFVDGNGRSGRLMWNNLRLMRGLPWYVQPARTKWRYYALIERYERLVFRPWLQGI